MTIPTRIQMYSALNEVRRDLSGEIARTPNLDARVALSLVEEMCRDIGESVDAVQPLHTKILRGVARGCALRSRIASQLERRGPHH